LPLATDRGDTTYRTGWSDPTTASSKSIELCDGIPAGRAQLSRFLMLKESAEARVRKIVVVLDWFEELTRLTQLILKTPASSSG